MSQNTTTILLSRDTLIESSYDVAIIKLNEFSHIPGQPVLVRYFDKNHKINSILAVGVLDGPGKENYVIVSNGEIEPVTGVYDDRIPDIANLVNKEIYVCYDPADGLPAYCIANSANTGKNFIKIPEDRTVYSIKDGFLWYITGNKIKRSDRYLDEESLTSILQEILNSGTLTVNASRPIYTWADNPDGVVNSGNYARVFNIPLGTSVVMAVAKVGAFSNNTMDIITYSNCLGNNSYNLTTKTKDFLLGRTSTIPIGIVRKATSSSDRFPATYKFIVLGSTCREEDIQWFSGTGFSGAVENLATIGSDKTFENYISVPYNQLGEATINAEVGNNFITVTKNSNKKKLTTVFENIPNENASYNFVIDSNISGFQVLNTNQQSLVDIQSVIYSGSVVSITKVGNEWVYNIQPPEIISKDGSVNIENTEEGKNLTVGFDNKEFVWLGSEVELSTFKHNSVRQNSWIRLIDFSVFDSTVDPIYQQHCLNTIEVKCKDKGLEGFIGVNLSPGSVMSLGSQVFTDLLKNNIEFAIESLSGNGYALYFRPVTEEYANLSIEFKLISTPLIWEYASENYSANNQTPYRIKNSYLPPITVQSNYTTDVLENNNKLIASSAVYSAIQNIQNQISSLDLASLENQINNLDNACVKSVKVNEQTILPTNGQVNVGTVYNNSNTRILNSEKEINGVIAKRGSLVYTDNSENETILSLSSPSVFYKVVANTLSWWCLGFMNNYGTLKITVSGSRLTTVTGNVYCYGTGLEDSTVYYTDNKTLAGYIKYNGKNLYIRGSQVHPFTVEIEDPTGETFNLIGNSVASDGEVLTMGTVKGDDGSMTTFSNIGGVSELTTINPSNYVVMNGTEPVIRIQESAVCDCFTFDVLFKDNLSHSLVVRLFLGGATVPSKAVELTDIYTYPGLIYTFTYKQDELIYTLKYDPNYPLTVSDLGVSVEAISNKVTKITENCTHDQYPSAKSVFDLQVGQRFKVTSAFDSGNGYGYQGAFKVTTPAVIDVYWTTNSGTYADTLYINGKGGKLSTYNIRCHNQLGIFSLKYSGGDFYVCIPAKKSNSSAAVTYNFSTPVLTDSAVNGTGTICTTLTTPVFFSTTTPSIFVGQNLDIQGDSIFNLTTTSTTAFNFNTYDTVIASASGNNIIIKGTNLPAEDKVYHIVNSTGSNISNLHIEGTLSSNNSTVASVNINNVQAGADVTLAWIAETKTFTYDISLQAIYSPNNTIKVEKSKNQWKLSVADSVMNSIAAKQPLLVYDPVPVANSTNAVNSGAVAAAINESRAPITLSLTNNDIGVRIYPVKDCTFRSDLKVTTIYYFDPEEYVLILDKEYDAIVAEYPPKPNDVTAGPNFTGQSALTVLDSHDMMINPIIRFVVPCGIVESVNVGGHNVAPGVTNGITEFHNGYSFKGTGLAFSTKALYSHKYLIGHNGAYPGVSTVQYRFQEYMFWGGYWYNPYGY